MSSIATIIKDEPLASTLRFGVFGLAACSIVGIAAYIGYKAATPNKTYPLQSRRPESNEQVNIIEISFFFSLAFLSFDRSIINHLIENIRLFCTSSIRKHDLWLMQENVILTNIGKRERERKRAYHRLKKKQNYLSHAMTHPRSERQKHLV